MGAITAATKEVIEQLKQAQGNVSFAAGKLGTSRETLRIYINAHPTVKAALADIREAAVDRAETMLQARMAESDTLLIFFLKTQGRNRGYVERHEHSGTLDVNVKGYAKISPDDWDNDTTETDRAV